jgi:hypothetical protein
MDDIISNATPPRVPPVEPDLLGSAIFLFSEYLQQIADLEIEDEDDDDDDEISGEEDEEDEEEDASPIEMRAVLDLFAEELGTSVPVTLNLYMRVTALFRLLAASPSLARLAAAEEDGSGGLSEDALLAFARLDLHVTRSAGGIVADFDARELRQALTNS